MGYTETAEKLHLISGQTAKTLRDVESVVGGIWPIGSAVLDLLMGGDDAVAERLEAIEEALSCIHRDLMDLKKEIVDQNWLAVELDRRRDIARELGPSRLARDLLKEVASQDNLASRPDPQMIKNESLRALETLWDFDGAFWLGVYDPTFIFRYGRDGSFSAPLGDKPSLFDFDPPPGWPDGYPDPVHQIAPPQLNGEVWDYRYVLPTYLEAIAIRLLVLEALEPNFRSTNVFAEEIKKHAGNIKDIFDRIREAITGGLQVPDLDLFVRRILLTLYPADQYWAAADSRFPHEASFGQCECFVFAGERYSGAGECLEVIPPKPPLDLFTEFVSFADAIINPRKVSAIREQTKSWVQENGIYGAFRARNWLLAEMLWRRVYSQVGLDSVRNTILYLWRTVNVIEGLDSASTLPDYTAWSVRDTLNEVIAELGSVPPPPLPGGGMSV